MTTTTDLHDNISTGIAEGIATEIAEGFYDLSHQERQDLTSPAGLWDAGWTAWYDDRRHAIRVELAKGGVVVQAQVAVPERRYNVVAYDEAVLASERSNENGSEWSYDPMTLEELLDDIDAHGAKQVEVYTGSREVIATIDFDGQRTRFAFVLTPA